MPQHRGAQGAAHLSYTAVAASIYIEAGHEPFQNYSSTAGRPLKREANPTHARS